MLQATKNRTTETVASETMMIHQADTLSHFRPTSGAACSYRMQVVPPKREVFSNIPLSLAKRA
jgi:hypothetical protein